MHKFHHWVITKLIISLIVNRIHWQVPEECLFWLWLMRRPLRTYCLSNIWKIPVMHPICFCNSGFSSVNTCRNLADILKSESKFTPSKQKNQNVISGRPTQIKSWETWHAGNPRLQYRPQNKQFELPLQQFSSHKSSHPTNYQQWKRPTAPSPLSTKFFHCIKNHSLCR